MEQEKNENITEGNGATLSKEEEKTARKERLKKRRLERRHKHNARIARGRFFKNLFIWLLGVLFLPTAIAAASFVVPIGTFTGNDGSIVSQDISKKSVFETARYVASNSDELGFSDFPIIAKTFDDLQATDIGDGKTLGDLIYIDTDKLNTIKFSSSNLSDDVQSCIEVVATIESLGGASMLGDIGGLSVFTEEEYAGTVDDISAKGEDAETKKQYYYKPSEAGTSTYAAAPVSEYKRAFDKDGNLVAGLSGTDKLYYPPLEKIKLSELAEIFGEAFGRTKVSSLLGIFGIEHSEENPNTLIKILGEDTTITGLGDFKVENVELSIVLAKKVEGEDGYSENAKLWSVLEDAIGELPEGRTEITIGDLANGFDLDKVPLNTVIKEITDVDDPQYDNNHKFWTILRQAVVLEEGEVLGDDDPITVGHLSKGFAIENVKLTDVIAVNDTDSKNSKLWQILEQAITDDEGNPMPRENITLDDLNYHFTVDGISLNTVLPDVSGNRVLSALKEKNVKIGDIGTSLNELSLYKVYGVSSFKTDTAVATLDMARSFYRVFNESGKTVYMLESNGVVSSAPTTEYYISYNASTLAMSYETSATLGAIDTSTEYRKCTAIAAPHGVSFQNSPDDTLYTFNDDVYYKTTDDNYYVLSGMTLYKITDDTLNDFFLDARDLLIKDSGTYYACYEGEDFKGYFSAEGAEDAGYTYDDTVSYIKTTDSSAHTVYVENEKYYLDKSAGIWLLLSFDTAEYDGDMATRRFADQHGKAYKYSVDAMTIGHLSTGSNFAKKFKNATIKQLVDSGLIDDPEFNSNESYKYSLQELLELMKTFL